MTHIIPEGTSEPQDFALANDGAALDGTGITVTLEIGRLVGTTVEDVVTPPTVAWLSEAGGTVRVTGTEILAVGNYLVRFKLTDGSSDIGFVPNGAQPDRWAVVPVLR